MAARARPLWAAPRSGAPPISFSRKAGASPPRRLRRPRPISASRTVALSWRGPTGRSACCASGRLPARPAIRSTLTMPGPGNGMTFPNGAHVVEVEIDRDTGEVNLARYTAVDDYGVVVNPMVAAGQAHGAIAQGAGQALLERAHYDPASGQLLAGSFMDYALPRADDLVPFGLGFNPTRCTTNPLGVKGCGEAGMVGGVPAVTNAI